MSRKIVNHFMGYKFISGFSISLFFVTYVLFLTAHGLDKLEIHLINVGYMLGIFLWEIPTGVFADMFGRKKSIIVGSMIFGLGMIMYAYSTTFWWFVIAESIGAFGSTFTSGALDAWIKDSLDHCDDEHNDTTVFSKGEISRNFSLIAGGLLGAYIGKYDLAFPWMLAGIGSIFSGIYVWLFFKEDYFVPKAKLNEIVVRAKEIFKTSFQVCLRKRIILLLIAFNCGVLLSYVPSNMTWALRFESYFGDVALIGYSSAFMYLSIILGNYWVKKKGENNDYQFLIYGVLLTGIGLILSALMNQIYLIVLMFLFHEVGRGVIAPVSKSVLNFHISAKERATILSFNTMLTSLAGVVGLVTGGCLTKGFSIEFSWIFSGVISISLIVIVFFMKKHE